MRAAPPRPVGPGGVRLSPLTPRVRAAPAAGIPASKSRRRQPAVEVEHSGPSGRTAHDLLLLLGIMGIAAFLRFWDLGRVGFRGDEAVYAGQAAVLAGVDRDGDGRGREAPASGIGDGPAQLTRCGKTPDQP